MAQNGTGNGGSEVFLRETAVAAAQRNAMERGCKFLPHGCRLFEVEQGWESTMISGDPSVAVADTLLALESALRDPENKVIFIPLDALVTDQDVEKLCQRNAILKTFFKEVKKQ
jgi:hypothetical protein